MTVKVNERDIFLHFNALMFAPDTGRIRKLLVRYGLFKKALEVPGDILECGVFKGAA